MKIYSPLVNALLLIVFLVGVLVLPQTAQAVAVISYIGACNGTTSCTPPAHQVGDLFLAACGRTSTASLCTVPSGWTSVTSRTVGNGSNGSSLVVACKVATTNSETITGFTNGTSLVAQVYRGQHSGLTAACTNGGSILGTINFFTANPGTTETFNAVTNGDASSWDVGFGYAPSATAGITTAPTNMINRSSNGTIIGGHDTNATRSSFPSANVTLTGSGRIITGVVEIKAGVATTPSFSAGTGTYNNDQSITISGDAGDTICYTTNGSTPAATTPGTCSTGSTYSSPVSITANATTLEAIATKAGTSNSAVQSATYTLTVGAITSSPGAGTYSSTQSVTLAITTTTGATAHYTTDGTAVTCSSPTYSGAFNVSVTTTVNAIACKTNYNSDTAISDLYTINSVTSPTVTTNSAESFTSTTATIFGAITATGGANANQSGFAWGTLSTLSGGDTATTTLGSQTGTASFNSALAGLSASQTYYYRAYADNTTGGGGIGYGSILSFSTGNTTPTRRMRLFEGFKIKLVSGTLKLIGP